LVGWLVNWLFGWLFGCLVGWLVGWLFGWLIEVVKFIKKGGTNYLHSLIFPHIKIAYSMIFSSTDGVSHAVMQ
jgi:NhaP-type Na+/H+ or K+/H+ antiporter